MKYSQIITETIQGEGAHAGELSMFLRLAICNLQCTWCDTKYSWEARYKNEWIPFNLERFMTWIPKNPENYGFVITGGEPLLQQNDSDFITLIEKTCKIFKRVTIETNGTIAPSQYLLYLLSQNIVFSVSPKLANSGEPLNRRFKLDALMALNISKNSYFKFVVENSNDVEEIFGTFGFINSSKIYLMPQGVSKQEIDDNSPRIAQLAVDVGLNFSPRLHISMKLQ